MSIITTPGNGTAFTTAELIINFERLAYMSSQHGEEPVPDPIVPDPIVPDPIVPSAEYTLLDVYNDVYRNIPNYVEHHGKRMIWAINRLREKGVIVFTDAEWGNLVSYNSAEPQNTAGIEQILNTLSISEFKLFHQTYVDLCNVRVKNFRKWFNISLNVFDTTNLYSALTDGNQQVYDAEAIVWQGVVEAFNAAREDYLLPIVNIRPMDDDATDNRLINYSNMKFLPNTVITVDWTPSSSATSTAVTNGQLIEMIDNGEDVTGVDVSGLTELIGIGGIHQNTFNQDISGWDVSNVTDMTNMFAENHAFSYDLSGWDVSSVTQCTNFGQYSGLTCDIMPNLPQACTGCDSV